MPLSREKLNVTLFTVFGVGISGIEKDKLEITLYPIWDYKENLDHGCVVCM